MDTLLSSAGQLAGLPCSLSLPMISPAHPAVLCCAVLCPASPAPAPCPVPHRTFCRDWRDVACSSDGTRIMAAAHNDYLYYSSDSVSTNVPRFSGLYCSFDSEM